MERLIKAMKGSSSVDIDKSCRLGGDKICNQGEIENIKIKPINEEIDASEGYNIDNSLQTVLDGRRNVCLIAINNDKNIIDIINKYKLHKKMVNQDKL